MLRQSPPRWNAVGRYMVQARFTKPPLDVCLQLRSRANCSSRHGPPSFFSALCRCTALSGVPVRLRPKERVVHELHRRTSPSTQLRCYPSQLGSDPYHSEVCPAGHGGSSETSMCAGVSSVFLTRQCSTERVSPAHCSESRQTGLSTRMRKLPTRAGPLSFSAATYTETPRVARLRVRRYSAA